MSEQMAQNWFQKLISGQRSVVKRKPQSFQRWIDLTERLEERQVLSAIMGTEELPPAVEVAPPVIETLSAASRKHQKSQGKAVEFPVLTGTWNLTATVTLDGDPPIIFTGTVQFSQNKGKLSGNVQLTGLPLFTVTGKLNKREVTDLHGSTKFPVEISEGNFRGVKAKLDLHFNENLQSFTGTANRTIFGYTIEVALAGTKQQ